MTARSLLVLILSLCSAGCGEKPASPVPAPVPAKTVYDVSAGAILRDHDTASGFAGHSVRVRLDTNEYTTDGREVRVWAGIRSVPPALVFKLNGPPAGAAALSGPIVVTGVCRGPVRDGVWRAPRIDFCVYVDDATATVISP